MALSTRCYVFRSGNAPDAKWGHFRAVRRLSASIILRRSGDSRCDGTPPSIATCSDTLIEAKELRDELGTTPNIRLSIDRP